ncbi:hypothetical protein ABZP36_004604 [Zizania latifolia]
MTASDAGGGGGGEGTNLDPFFDDVEGVKEDMSSLKGLHQQLQSTHEESKTAHDAQAVKSLRGRMDTDVEQVLHRTKAVKVALSLIYMFFFAWLEDATGGTLYNPLTVLAGALASPGGPSLYLFTAFVRIPVQVLRSILGVKLIRAALSTVGKGIEL